MYCSSELTEPKDGGHRAPTYIDCWKHRHNHLRLATGSESGAGGSPVGLSSQAEGSDDAIFR